MVNALPLESHRQRPARVLVGNSEPPVLRGRHRRVARTGIGVSLRKLPSGRWHARLKSGRIYVMGKTFDTRRDAQAWLTGRGRPSGRPRSARRQGHRPEAALFPTWLEERRDTVTAKTYAADSALPRLLPVRSPQCTSALTDRDVSRALITLTRPLAVSSVRRFRPRHTRMGCPRADHRLEPGDRPLPAVGKSPVEMHPFSEQDLRRSGRWPRPQRATRQHPVGGGLDASLVRVCSPCARLRGDPDAAACGRACRAGRRPQSRSPKRPCPDFPSPTGSCRSSRGWRRGTQ